MQAKTCALWWKQCWFDVEQQYSITSDLWQILPVVLVIDSILEKQLCWTLTQPQFNSKHWWLNSFWSNGCYSIKTSQSELVFTESTATEEMSLKEWKDSISPSQPHRTAEPVQKYNDAVLAACGGLSKTLLNFFLCHPSGKSHISSIITMAITIILKNTEEFLWAFLCLEKQKAETKKYTETSTTKYNITSLSI